MQNFFALSRSHQSACSFAAMEIALLVTAKLPRCISCPVILERHGNFVKTNKAVLARGYRQFFVIVMPFENKRVGVRPSDRRYEFVAHNSAPNFWIAFFAGRRVEWQINFRS